MYGLGENAIVGDFHVEWTSIKQASLVRFPRAAISKPQARLIIASMFSCLFEYIFRFSSTTPNAEHSYLPFFFSPVFSCVAVHFFFIPHELRYCSSFFIRPLPTGWPIHSCGVRHLFTIHYVLTVVRYSIVISQLSGGGIDLVWGKKMQWMNINRFLTFSAYSIFK